MSAPVVSKTSLHLSVAAVAAVIMIGTLRSTPGHASRSTPVVSNGGHMQATIKGKPVVLPLKRTEVRAEVAGIVASVRVTQRFHNPYGEPIEARYVFPLPHRSAVYAMTIRVGKRTIKGVVKRRKRARAIYRRARARGKTAALLEQERPNIFTQSVANIMPGDKIEVQLSYVEDLVPEEGRYEFAFPMVVGPRYVGGGEPVIGQKGTGWGKDTTRIPDASRITPRLLAKGLRPGHDIDVQLRINAGVQVQGLKVVTHRASVTQKGPMATVRLDPRDSIPNKDFVVRYRLSGKAPQATVLAHRDRRGGHFLLMIQPKARMTRREVAPREYIFVVDNSGSMYGFPLQQAQAVVRRCLRGLTRRDTFQIIKFAGSPDQFAARAVRATPTRIKEGIRYVGQMSGGGGTELIPALKLALEADKDRDRSRIVLFITDGYVGYEREVLRYLRNARHARGVNIFALGVGSAVNRFLIDGMARIGAGHPFYLLNSERAADVVKRIFATISRPALTSIRLGWGGLAVRDLAPGGRVPDLFADKPVLVAGRYSAGGSSTITVQGRLAGKPYLQRVQVTLPDKPTGDNEAVAYLWARRQVASWMDVLGTEPDRAKEMEKKVTKVALRYNLISRFTSLVAVDNRVRNKRRKLVTVPVPVARPDGVSARAAPRRAHVGAAAAISSGPDMDGDGICDADDRCPASPEVYNGLSDSDGCPDAGRVVVHKGRIEVLDKIYFRSFSSKIQPVSHPILDAIVATLKGNPQIQLVEIQGHADRREPRRLARLRALAVLRYLIRRGVVASRLKARGYGGRRPVDRRHNPVAWSKNRRVEFLILKRSP